MKAQWKDYKYGAWLVLIFGSVDAKIVDLDGSEARGVMVGRWGIITHPASTFEITGTRVEAKQAAETALRETMNAALALLP